MRKLAKAFALIIMLLLPSVILADPADITRLEKTITPSSIETGGEATVTLKMSGDVCVASGVDVAIVIDRSWSMYDSCNATINCPNPPEDRIGPAVDAAKAFINRFSTNDQATIVAFARNGEVRAPLSNQSSQSNAALDGLINDPANTGSTSGTAIGAGINAATSELRSARHNQNNAAAMIVLSDGEENLSSDPTGQANNACNPSSTTDQAIKVFSIGLGSQVDPSMEQIPCNGGFYRAAPTPAELDEIYQNIANTILAPPATNTTIIDTIPANLSLVAGSISNGGTSSANQITWQINQLQQETELTYRLTSNTPGTYPIGPGEITYTKCDNTTETLTFPQTTLTVNAPPSPPTPTVAPAPPSPTAPPAPPPPNEIPEPATIALLGGGLASLAAYARRRRATKS
ncbi:MAG: vWA domain-containing protein [Ardenticatenaceae bacterium]